MVSDAQKRARDKWNKRNKERKKIIDLRSSCKRYIREFATIDDLQDLQQLINERKKQLTEQAR